MQKLNFTDKHIADTELLFNLTKGNIVKLTDKCSGGNIFGFITRNELQKTLNAQDILELDKTEPNWRDSNPVLFSVFFLSDTNKFYNKNFLRNLKTYVKDLSAKRMFRHFKENVKHCSKDYSIWNVNNVNYDLVMYKCKFDFLKEVEMHINKSFDYHCDFENLMSYIEAQIKKVSEYYKKDKDIIFCKYVL